jgi:hypothetical protein
VLNGDELTRAQRIAYALPVALAHVVKLPCMQGFMEAAAREFASDYPEVDGMTDAELLQWAIEVLSDATERTAAEEYLEMPVVRLVEEGGG